MSTILPPSRSVSAGFAQLLARAMEREYLPGIEPYLAWLRQPVGWFIAATFATLLVGFTVSPMALSLAAGLSGLLVIGLAYPWLAVRLAHCELSSDCSHLEEDMSHQVQVRLRNRCPWPIWGLIIEGYVVSPIDDDRYAHLGDAHSGDAEHPSADIALGPVAWLSLATYQLAVQPRMRGRYPIRVPQLTCSFPFGLWTARRPLENVAPLVVHPKQVKLTGVVEQSGRTSHHGGIGSRAGGHGDFLGLRDYRRGDSIRHIHWAHTARLDSLVVCERSLTEQAPWQVVLDVTGPDQACTMSRENLAWRVRIAASLCAFLHQQSIPFQLTIDGEDTWSRSTLRLEGNRLQAAIERLTDVPLDGTSTGSSPKPEEVGHANFTVIIEPLSMENGDPWSVLNSICLRLNRPVSNWRQSNDSHDVIIDLNRSLEVQMNAWLQRLKHDRHAA